MKKHLRIATFLFGLVVLLLGLSVLFQPKSEADSQSHQEIQTSGILAERENSLDVLIFGNSEAYTSMSPLQIWGKHGITSYVGSTPSQRLFLTEQFLHKATEKQNPKVVILETNNFFTAVDEDRKFADFVDGVFPIAKHHDRWKLALLEKEQRAEDSFLNADNKGFQINDKTRPLRRSDYMKPSDKREKIPQENVNYVLAMRDFCRERNIRFVLISVPSAANWTTERHNAVDDLAKHNHIEFYDLNEQKNLVAIDWMKETMDRGDHLNYEGAYKVTEWLGAFLKEDPNLKDHREDPAYQDWQEAYQNYASRVGLGK